MYKSVALAAALSTLSLGIAAPAVAGNPMKMSSDTPRILRISKGICASSKQQMVSWARKVDGFGSFAVPRYPAGQTVDCSASGATLPIGKSWGFGDQQSADAAALAACTANLPSGFKTCAVIGQSFAQ